MTLGNVERTPANTVVDAVEQDDGTTLIMEDGNEIFVPREGSAMDDLFGPGDDPQAIFDESGDPVISFDPGEEIINVYDDWDADNAYDFDYGGDSGGWGWGSLGFGSWYDFGGGGGGGGGGYYDDFAEYEEMLGY